MNVRKVVIVAASGVCGGVVGYLLADMLIYKFQEKQISEDIMEEFEKRVEEYKPSNPEAPVDYTRMTKPKANLNELVAPYLGIGQETEDLSVPLFEIISHNEWVNLTNRDQFEIMYYGGDNAYTLEDELIASPSDLIGPREGLHFGELSEDPDVVYIRNNDLEADYEVIRVHGKYSTLVLGLSEEEAEQKPKRKRKTNNGTE